MCEDAQYSTGDGGRECAYVASQLAFACLVLLCRRCFMRLEDITDRVAGVLHSVDAFISHTKRRHLLSTKRGADSNARTRQTRKQTTGNTRCFASVSMSADGVVLLRAGASQRAQHVATIGAASSTKPASKGTSTSAGNAGKKKASAASVKENGAGAESKSSGFSLPFLLGAHCVPGRFNTVSHANT